MWAVSGKPCRHRASGPVSPAVEAGELEAVGLDRGRGDRHGVNVALTGSCVSHVTGGSPGRNHGLRSLHARRARGRPVGRHLLRSAGFHPVRRRQHGPLRREHVVRRSHRTRPRTDPVRPRHGPALLRPGLPVEPAPRGPRPGHPPPLGPRPGPSVLARRCCVAGRSSRSTAPPTTAWASPRPSTSSCGRRSSPCGPTSSAATSASHTLDPGARIEIAGATVTTAYVPHTDTTFGYRVERNGVSVAYVSDHQQPADPTHIDPGVLELCRGVDLLIHDAQYTEAEFAAKSTWGHCTIEYAVARGRRGRRRAPGAVPPRPRARRRHHRPAAVRRRVVAARRRGLRQVVAASEGMRISLDGRAGPGARRLGRRPGLSSTARERTSRATPTFDTAKFRQVLGHFPTGVTVITAINDGVPVGMAIGSFASLSLDPPAGAVLPGEGRRAAGPRSRPPASSA